MALEIVERAKKDDRNSLLAVWTDLRLRGDHG
jgi:hypothetical protein